MGRGPADHPSGPQRVAAGLDPEIPAALMLMDTASFQDHYATLGVPVDADATAIRRAFRQKVREVHPDVSANKEEATENFLRIKEAYNVLSDPAQRSRYDLQRSNFQARAHAQQEARERGTSYRRPGADTWDAHQESLTVPDLLKRAMEEIANGRYRHARSDLARILAQEPQNPDALILMGRLYQAENRMGEWIRILDESLRANPMNVPLRMALNEARKVAAERGDVYLITDSELEQRRKAYRYMGIVVSLACFLWGIFHKGPPVGALEWAVSAPAPLLWGTIFTAVAIGWTMAASDFITQIDDELFYPDTAGRSLHKKYGRNDAPLGLAVPVLALIHYAVAVGVMAILMVSRSTISRSLLIVSGTALVLAVVMAIACPSAAGGILWWCPGWLLFALFVGWGIGDFVRT